MRAWLLLASFSASFATLAACATSDEENPAQTSVPDSGLLPPAPDAAAAPDVESDATFPTCSKAGWCTTPLPDGDLRMKDVWPLGARAFAIAESDTLGVKILEWKDGDAAFRYIDDDTQNAVGVSGKYAGAIWAPNDDTVYYAVAPSDIWRGTRPAPPADTNAWSWSRQRLGDNSHVGEAGHATATHDHGNPWNSVFSEYYPALGIWGIDESEIYAWYSNTIYHWKSDDGGGPSWVAEYVANDLDVPSEHLFFVSAAGSGPDDVWFAGVRTRYFPFTSARDDCAFVVHKTAEGYKRVADGVAGNECADRPGVPRIDGPNGWVTNIQSTRPGAIVGLKGNDDIVRISADVDALTVSVDAVPTFTAVGTGSGVRNFRSLWQSPEDVWLTSWGLVVRGHGTGDAATYAVSTISLNGSPVGTPMHRVRGTSATNLWAIGNGYAFHKTTP